jgi:multidrug efflux pump subunit AcrB
VTDVLLHTPGIQSVVGVDGFSLLTLTESTNTAFFFVTLKPWDQRKSRSEQIEAIQASMQQKLSGNSQGLAFAFPPPAIPGIGTAGGVTMILQDRSGNDDPSFLTKNV